MRAVIIERKDDKGATVKLILSGRKLVIKLKFTDTYISTTTSTLYLTEEETEEILEELDETFE